MTQLDLSRTAQALAAYDAAQTKWNADPGACAREWYEGLSPEKRAEVIAVLARQEGWVGPKPTVKTLLEPEYAAELELAWILIEDDRLGREVGRAFGLDTADRNSMDTCVNCVRPDTWLRRNVEQWRTTTAQ